jgi:hypothetical protein
VSVPITSGRRLVEWVRQATGNTSPAAEDGDFRRQVIEPNRAEARVLVRTLRGSLSGIIIDPTALSDIPGWTQANYHHLWARVVERYASRVVFGEGWQYSRGCAFEYLTAAQAGIATLDDRLRPIPIEQGIAAIDAATTTIRGLHQETEILESVLRGLARLKSTQTEDSA